MKLISWNVNGLRAISAKGDLHKFFAEADADVFCLQQTKNQPGKQNLEFQVNTSYLNLADKKA